MALTEDGHAILYNSATRNYEYAVLDENGIVAGGIAVSSPEKREMRRSADFLTALTARPLRHNSAETGCGQVPCIQPEPRRDKAPDKVVRIAITSRPQATGTYL